MKTKLLTPDEAAARLRVHVRTIYIWLRTGVLNGTKFGGRWRIDEQALNVKGRTE